MSAHSVVQKTYMMSHKDQYIIFMGGEWFV